VCARRRQIMAPRVLVGQSGYPQDMQEIVTGTVIQHAKLVAVEWAMQGR
jgi:hypothetical protein